METENTLLTLQRRFMAALLEPISGDSRERTPLPPRHGGVSDRFVETADALISPSATLRPAERLELYHRQYWYRLLDSIDEDFPALKALLGDEAFWGLVEAYLELLPPTSFTLRHLGSWLADFIAAKPSGVPNPVHAEELARLEYALCAAFEAGEHPSVAATELTQAPLRLQPHLQLLALRSNADTLWRRVDRGDAPGSLTQPSAAPNRFVAVFRQDLTLHVERLPRAAFAMLSAIDDSGTLEGAMDHVAGQRGLLRRRDIARIQEWFARWTGRGWFLSSQRRIK